jgi:hypothetical protein
LLQGRGLTDAAEADAGNGVRDIDALLSRLGLGPLGSLAGAVSLAGRNENWAAVTSLGNEVVVKRFGGTPGEAAGRMRRSLAFEHTVGQVAHESFATPRCLGSDAAGRLIVFEHIDGARSGADLLLSSSFDDDLAHEVGLAIGELHAVPAGTGRAANGSAASAERTVPPLPSADLLEDGLPVAVYASCSAAELAAWSLMQHDRALAGAVRQLLDLQARAAATPAHCDLRLEQLFVAAGRLYLCDWEEFRLADPARDVGSFAGEWLHQAALTMTAEHGGEDTDTLSHDEIVRRITAAIERMRPRIATFWAGYRGARPAADADLAVRAAAFAGWHMFDRMLAIARRSARLRAVDRAAAGIGRAILLAPGDFAATLGLDPT